MSVAPLQLLQYPLSDPNYEQHSRSWLLLILRGSVRRTSLAYFATTFLPMASALKAKATEAAQSNSERVYKTYLTLLEQVWALLPGFCDEPLDLQAALMAQGGQLAKQLVAVLQGEPALRDHVWAAFKHCGDAAREPPSEISAALKESNITCLRTLSTRIMPEMFNAYLKIHTEAEGQDASRVSHSRTLALGAVQSLARIAEAAFIGSLFKSLVAKWLKSTTGEGNSAEAAPLGELANALLPHLPADLLELALKVFGPALKGGAAAENDPAASAIAQKAAYRAVCNVLRHPGAATGCLSNPADLVKLWESLREARQTCSPAALKGRLHSIQALLALLETSFAPHFQDPTVKQEYLKCLTTLVPEILFHLRDQSTAVRDAARECLHLAAGTAIHQELQAEIVTLLSAGLAGLSRHSKAGALDALSRLLYEHHGNMSAQLRNRLIAVVLMLLEDRDAQVWRAALKFTKVIVFVLPKEELVDVLPKMMKLFESRHLATAKMLVRKIVGRLVKVMSEEVLLEVFPKAHLPLLQHVQKQLARQQRPKGVREKVGGDEEEDGDEDDVEMDGPQGRKKKQKADKASWEAFRAGDDADGDAADMEDVPARSKKRRGRDDDEDMGGASSSTAGRKLREPPNSALVQHDAVQALLDAWEEEDDSDGEGGKRKSKRKRDAATASTWIQEDQDLPLDFMSADAAHSVLTMRAPPSKRRKGTEVGNAGATDRAEALRRNGLRFADDGRLVVDDSKDEEQEENTGKSFTLGADTKKTGALSQLAARREARAKAKAKLKTERRGSHIIRGLDGFKPGKKKAQGDAKRSSKLEPYAYVRLNPKVTKEKFKDKATASFSKVIKGAKKGVLKGMKARANDMKGRQAAEMKKQRKKRNQKAQKHGSR
eukprot:TRINITY_DN2234_c0_g2_i1.p1 TRINITY_DN2234_c0_g2~~TRINITY_DN2234_c0_g2_i1.p1  ORF type:complete len:978 (+),score=249.09 TRINITY_DN2234_c0_g2_i1:273-2936(+)